MPDRRLHFTRTVDWDTGSMLVGFGADADGKVREIFPCDGREGSDRRIDTIASFMMASWLMQSGMSAGEMLTKLVGGVAGETGSLHPPLVARALSEALCIEAEDGDEIRANYAHEAMTRAERRSIMAREKAAGAKA
jgi:hypothetical protein